MVRMQGQGMAGELLPLCGGATQWSGGDKVVTGGSYDTPRTGRGVSWLDDLIRFGWPLRLFRPAWLLVNSTHLHAELSPVLQFYNLMVRQRVGLLQIRKRLDDV